LYLVTFLSLSFSGCDINLKIGLAQKYTISGRLSDAESGELLIAANVFDRISLKGAVTNTYGFYSLTLPKGKVELEFSYVGYQPVTKSFELDKDTILDISISSSVQLKEVVVTSQKNGEKIFLSPLIGFNLSKLSFIGIAIKPN